VECLDGSADGANSPRSLRADRCPSHELEGELGCLVLNVDTTWERGRGWHMGIRSEVRLAAMIPASRATSSGSPLGFFGNAFSTDDFSATKALAAASRLVACLVETSTILARPDLS